MNAAITGSHGNDARGFATIWAAALLILVVASIALLWFPVWRIGSVVAFNYNEGWNAYRDRMAAEGVALYGAPPGLWVTNYPFLSFHIVGLFGRLLGTMVLAGRLVALGALVAICGLVAGIVRRITGAWPAGVFAGLGFFLWVATFTPNRIAVDDPEFLGAAISLSGLYAYVRGPRDTRWLAASATGFALGVFTKQDGLALPLGVALHLLITRNGRGAAAWMGCGLLVAALLLAASYHWDGDNLFAHLLRARPYSIGQSLHATAFYLERFGAPLGLGVAVLALDRCIAFRGCLLILLALAFGFAVLFAGGDGVALNIFYIPLMMTAIITGVAVQAIAKRAGVWRCIWAGPIVALTLALPVVSSLAILPGKLADDRGAMRQLPADAAVARRTIALLKSYPGPAICQTILLCYEAGKPLDFDPFFVRDQVETGRLRLGDVRSLLAARHYPVIEIDRAAFVRRSKPRSRFFLAFMQALRAHYRCVQAGPIDTVFVPRPES